ncbi:ribbon-helix-helix protein, CopG family [Sediminihabitans luteus]|uniref:ribbon-helix-helix protein, CopG family n=1 Tax=Sediminihabitans luteus TaxID=1138585 RepID=UPI0012FD2D18|nr:ribbon-helix-helix protein, CopG family [Sediminihabitans luteus]
MSLLERRLQILVDQERYARLEAEATARGSSVATVVREAIDQHFASDVALRASAARDFLAEPLTDAGPEPDWAESKRALVGDIAPQVP